MRKYALPALAAALICGFLHSLPHIGSPPSPSALASVARGLAASGGLGGFVPASVADRIAAAIWQSGGASGLAWWEGGSVFLVWSLIPLLAGILAILVAERWLSAADGPAFLAALAAGVLLTGIPGLVRGAFQRGKPVFTLPTELVGHVLRDPPGSVFADASALESLLLLAPGITGTLNATDARALALQPVKWRAAMREKHWTTVVLTGPLSEYRPLLDHLIASPDWRLGCVSHHGFVFERRSGAQGEIPDPAIVRMGDDRETAVALAQLAQRLDAIREAVIARQALERALKLRPNDPDVLAESAAFRAGRNQWIEALSDCDRALARRPNSSYLLLLKARCLLELGRPGDAERAVTRITPSDLYTLFLSARIARELHDYRSEAATLARLIQATREQTGAVPADYYVYLGQAYARQSDAANAVTNYELALNSPGIGPELAAEVREAIATIREKSKGK